MKTNYKIGDRVTYGEEYRRWSYKHEFGKWDEREEAYGRFYPESMSETENLCIRCYDFSADGVTKVEELDPNVTEARNIIKFTALNRGRHDYDMSEEDVLPILNMIDHFETFKICDEVSDRVIRANASDNQGEIIGKYRQTDYRGVEKGKIYYKIRLDNPVPYGRYAVPMFLNGYTANEALTRAGHDGFDALSPQQKMLLKSLERVSFAGDLGWTDVVLSTYQFIAPENAEKEETPKHEVLHDAWDAVSEVQL